MAEQSTQQVFTSNRWISKRRVLKIGMAGALAVLGSLRNYWVFMHNTASTQDAYAKADSAQIRTRVSGTVSRVLVDNKDPGRTTVTERDATMNARSDFIVVPEYTRLPERRYES
jgi:hypothetical protein